MRRKYFYALLFTVITAFQTLGTLARVEEKNGLYFAFDKLDNEQSIRNWQTYAVEAAQIVKEISPLGVLAQEGLLAQWFPVLIKDINILQAIPGASTDEKILDLQGRAASMLTLKFIEGLEDGIRNFGKVTRLNTDAADVFVAFASTKDPRTFNFDDLDSFKEYYRGGDLLMNMGVFTKKHGGFVVIHMGISRCAYNMLKGPHHPRISTLLHGFSAYTMLGLYEHSSALPGALGETVTTMVTTPLDSMTDILLKAGLDEREISVGERGKNLSAPRLSWLGGEFMTIRDHDQNVVYNVSGLSYPRIFDMLHINCPSVVVDLVNLQKLWLKQ